MPAVQFIRREPERTLKIIEAYIEKNLEVPVIVEGTKDMEALRKIGFRGRVIVYNSGLSAVAFSEWVSRTEKRVILLMDFDRTGSILRRRLSSILSAVIQEVDIGLWVYIRRHLPVRTVEELPAIIEALGSLSRAPQPRRKRGKNRE